MFYIHVTLKQGSQPVDHGIIYDGLQPGIIDIKYVLQIEPFNKKCW